MVLPLFPRNKIVDVYDEINFLFPSHDNDLARLYSYFGNVWLRSFPIDSWCQYDSLFRTNNVAESFHATLATRFLNHHPEFYSFVDAVHNLFEETKMKFHAQRLNPKTRIHRAELTRRV